MEQNKTLKRFASVFLASSLVVGALAGCGSSESGSSTSTSTEGGNSSDANESAEVIKIGANLELSGDVASYGSSILKGAQLAIEEINAKGGIDGKQIELVSADNKSENAEAVAAALKLATQDKVHAMIGPATSGNMLATVQIANTNKVPVVTASGTAENLTVNEDGSINEYVFRTCFIDPFQGVVAANFATELGAKNVAIYADNSSDYAKGLAKAFKEQIIANGGTVVAEEAYVANDVDFKSTLTNLKSANPDFVFIPGYYEEVGLIVKQARELGIEAPLMGGDGWDSPTLVELAGADALNNTYMSNAFSSEDPEELIQDFVKAFEEKNGEKPNGFHALGYDTAYYIADAIDRADSLDGEAIKNALAETTDFAGVTGSFSVDEKHNPIKSATILEFKDGSQVFNSKVNP
ncbi:ethanolamine utilization protein EutJ [Ureibacillus massiliensis 4400831 = CIP 108448 = CCUG 49529]|uniref:Ethanolamine utilization protein EutJ n=1 Tax=Ureibacillus massiliensis 4400831 = CIP 108448 = CCUG 49529 TaxID=1211035 RepID=A0A0A3J4S3_9BACL|nr:ABC transporter substrate-binding protein [Ureibacillus massiliensis]KGR91926.1 ethanolamine utilization protein EutJ [Ureibacillus massiliensis 4400831 = CIP 108448 = CCUG 49529]